MLLPWTKLLSFYLVLLGDELLVPSFTSSSRTFSSIFLLPSSFFLFGAGWCRACWSRRPTRASTSSAASSSSRRRTSAAKSKRATRWSRCVSFWFLETRLRFLPSFTEFRCFDSLFNFLVFDSSVLLFYASCSGLILFSLISFSFVRLFLMESSFTCLLPNFT